ncbi:hypothetical protein BTN50_2096 [Candidatus Enterovibrio altilux]|uniref:Uncharacterized protein n=1 Tax=Candidatus Enterovibrio altilux TaxID=1927128 RepID=A0A291BBY8_9GAMM|nr:hypothetical protein BTN50_2096 [Candidatus Enterovibrio luxaltus]
MVSMKQRLTDTIRIFARNVLQEKGLEVMMYGFLMMVKFS